MSSSESSPRNGANASPIQPIARPFRSSEVSCGSRGSILFFEDHVHAGKMTPVHIHPDADEVFYVLEGEIVVHAEDGTEHRVPEGGFATALRGVPHVFMALVETRLLCMQTPASGQEFFRHASEAATTDRIDGPVTSIACHPPPRTAAWRCSARRPSMRPGRY